MAAQTGSFDIDALRSFLAVAEHSGFTGAANATGTTQSTVSMRVRRLEQAVGTPLFRREGRGARLTVDGERLQAHARELVRVNDAAWQDLTGTQVTGTVRLGIPDDYSFYLPETLRAFAERHPAVSLEVRCDLSVGLVAQVRRGDLDLAIVTRQRNSPGGTLLRREPLVWAAAHGSFPEHTDPVPLTVFPREACVFREHATRALTETGRRWRVIHTSKSVSGQRAFVGSGLAVTPLTASMLPADLRMATAADGLPDLPPVDIALHRAPGRPPEPARRLAEILRTRLQRAEP